MKANEFRIGNLIDFYGEIKEIEGVSKRQRPDVGYFQVAGIEAPQKGIHIKPIPLTEEWLLKFGFISNPYADCYDFNGIKIECDKTRGSLELWCSNITGRITYLTSVHQLQNLVFALTGEELTLK